MTPTLNPREDALAKLLAEVKERISNCGPCVHVYALHAKLDKALSAPPSQSGAAEAMREAAVKLCEAEREKFRDTNADRFWQSNRLMGMIAALPALTPSPTPYVRPAAEALEPRCYQCGGPVSGMECESCEANQNPPEEHEIIKAIVDELFELNPDCSKSTIAEVALSVVRKFLLRHPGALT